MHAAHAVERRSRCAVIRRLTVGVEASVQTRVCWLWAGRCAEAGRGLICEIRHEIDATDLN